MVAHLKLQSSRKVRNCFFFGGTFHGLARTLTRTSRLCRRNWLFLSSTPRHTREPSRMRCVVRLKTVLTVPPLT
jgi:hypothetical protein